LREDGEEGEDADADEADLEGEAEDMVDSGEEEEDTVDEEGEADLQDVEEEGLHREEGEGEEEGAVEEEDTEHGDGGAVRLTCLIVADCEYVLAVYQGLFCWMLTWHSTNVILAHSLLSMATTDFVMLFVSHFKLHGECRSRVVILEGTVYSS